MTGYHLIAWSPGTILFGETWPIALICVCLAILLIIVIFLMRAAKQTTHEQSKIIQLRPQFFFWLNILYMLLLVGIAMVYTADSDLQQAIPNTLGGVLPIAVPWFGAIGAVMISMQGVLFLNDQWKPKWNYWHIARPLTGGIMGTVAFFLLILINAASGTTPSFLNSPPTDGSVVDGRIIYWVLAFLVGYREETFRDLIKRVTDLVLRPGGEPAKTAPAVTFKVNDAKTVKLVCKLSEAVLVEVHNSGDAPLSDPKVDVAGGFTKEEDGVTGQEIGPGEHKTVKVKRVDANAPATGSLTVKGSNLEAPATIPIAAE